MNFNALVEQREIFHLIWDFKDSLSSLHVWALLRQDMFKQRPLQ